MTRRDVFKSAIAATAAVAVPADVKPRAAIPTRKDEWITVAHSGRTSNGNYYGDAAMTAMARQARGQLAVFSYGNPSQIRDAVGVVMASRVSVSLGKPMQLDIKVKWVSGVPVPVGKFVSPIGTAKPNKDQGGFFVDADYRLEGFLVADTSAFALATAV